MITASSDENPSVEKCTLWVHGPLPIVGPCTHRVHFSTLGM
jgi:hypothetical protein